MGPESSETICAANLASPGSRRGSGCTLEGDRKLALPLLARRRGTAVRPGYAAAGCSLLGLVPARGRDRSRDDDADRWAPWLSRSGQRWKDNGQLARSTTMRRVHRRGSSSPVLGGEGGEPGAECWSVRPRSRTRCRSVRSGRVRIGICRMFSPCGSDLRRVREQLKVGHEAELEERRARDFRVVVVELDRQQEPGPGVARRVAATFLVRPWRGSRSPRAARPREARRAAGRRGRRRRRRAGSPRRWRRQRSPRRWRACPAGRRQAAAGAGVPSSSGLRNSTSLVLVTATRRRTCGGAPSTKHLGALRTAAGLARTAGPRAEASTSTIRAQWPGLARWRAAR